MSRKDLLSDIAMARKELSVERVKKILKVCVTIAWKAY
jgi:predicted ATPase with chaperone activity